MIKLNRMTRKRWAAMLLAAAFMIASAPAAYADGPSGPASDTAIAENSREEAKGPGAGPEQQPAQPEQPRHLVIPQHLLPPPCAQSKCRQITVPMPQFFECCQVRVDAGSIHCHRALSMLEPPAYPLCVGVRVQRDAAVL